MDRLQKIIAQSGIASRRGAEQLILENRVRVNGQIINTLGVKVDTNDKIEVDGKRIKPQRFEYYLLNKPRGYICTTNDDKDRKIVCDLIDTKAKIYPVGRLDYNTTGLLILTNDGKFKNILEHPSNKVTKTYLAKLNNIIDSNTIEKIKKGFKIDGRFIRPKKIKIKKIDKDKQTCIVEIVIFEGLNHEVKKIFELFNYDVVKLTRTREYIFTLDKLNSGDYRKLTVDEIKSVYDLES